MDLYAETFGHVLDALAVLCEDLGRSSKTFHPFGTVAPLGLATRHEKIMLSATHKGKACRFFVWDVEKSCILFQEFEKHAGEMI